MNTDDVLKYGNLKLLGHVEKLPEDEWYTQGVCGWWSVRDIIGHLASFELMFIDIVKSLGESATVGSTLERFRNLGGEKFNHEQVAKRQNHKPTEVLAEYTGAHDLLRELVSKISPETLRTAGLFPWYGEEYDLEDMICYASYGHKREHSAQIAVFLDTLNIK